MARGSRAAWKACAASETYIHRDAILILQEWRCFFVETRNGLIYSGRCCLLMGMKRGASALQYADGTEIEVQLEALSLLYLSVS